MVAKTGFIGQKRVLNKRLIKTRLIKAIKSEIAKGRRTFTVGDGGEFDRLALSVCKSVKSEGACITVEVALRPEINGCGGRGFFYRYADVVTRPNAVSYKQTVLDECGVIICYVNPKSRRGGYSRLAAAAKNRGIELINLY